MGIGFNSKHFRFYFKLEIDFWIVILQWMSESRWMWESRFIISSIWIGTEQLVTNRTEISGNDLCCETGRMPDWQDARILMPASNQVALCVTWPRTAAWLDRSAWSLFVIGALVRDVLSRDRAECRALGSIVWDWLRARQCAWDGMGRGMCGMCDGICQFESL